MTLSRTFTLALAVAALLAPLGVAASASTPTERGARPEVRATFDYIKKADGRRLTNVRVSGTAEVIAEVVQRDGGAIRAATNSRAGQDRAVQFPAFDGTAGAPRAVIGITNATAADELNPGTRRFSYGADFVLDAVSSVAGTTDDGDNLLQRGLFEDADQYKLQLDGRRPSCRIAGSAGGAASSALVTSTVVADSSSWYRAECVRRGQTLKVVVTRFDSDGTREMTTTKTNSARVIDVTMSSTSVPLSIGGALSATGTVFTHNDQFNGYIDNVSLQIR